MRATRSAAFETTSAVGGRGGILVGGHVQLGAVIRIRQQVGQTHGSQRRTKNRRERAHKSREGEGEWGGRGRGREGEGGNLPPNGWGVREIRAAISRSSFIAGEGALLLPDVIQYLETKPGKQRRQYRHCHKLHKRPSGLRIKYHGYL